MHEFARCSFKYGNYTYYYILRWQLLLQNAINNTSTIKLEAIIQVNTSYISWSRGSATLHTDKFNLANTYYQGNTVVHTTTITVGHNSDGTRQVYIAGSIDTTFVMNGSCGGTITLPPIKRYFTKTPTIAFVSSDPTSATINWSTSESCNWVRYHLDGSSSWVDVFNGTSNNGTFKINNLEPNSTHTVYVECRRADSNMWSNSNTIQFTVSAKTVKIVVNGEVKEATPYVGTNGKWNVAIPYLGKDEWKRCK